MAIWQFDFYIINQRNVLLYDETKPFDENECYLSWEKQEINNESILLIKKVLPIEKSWSNRIKQYGKIDETCIKVFNLDEKYCQISCRIDLRKLSRELFYGVINFIQLNNGHIVHNNKCYIVEENVLIQLLKESKAYNFCKDPELFLTNIGDN